MGDGRAPRCEGDTWVFDLPAEQFPPRSRRSEVFVMNDGRQVVGREGDDVVEDFVLDGNLGPSGQGDDAWHVLWQLQGPTGDEWRAPPIGVQVRDGRLFLGGGGGHVGHDPDGSDYEWRYPLAAYRDGTPTRVRVITTLSSDPRRGVVSAWIDGRQVLDRWVPTSPQGLQPGTLYEGQQAVWSRVGLYRGSQGESPPTDEQSMRIRIRESRID